MGDHVTISPILEEIAQNKANKITIAKINIV